jgi:hypothetical protein
MHPGATISSFGGYLLCLFCTHSTTPIVQCCLAFYEGATSKADLIARISGAQDPITLKPEAQKTLALINNLSEGNFKRIVFADPALKKYFFIKPSVETEISTSD